MDLIIKDTKADFNEYFDICNASDETKEKFETKDFLVVPSKYQDKEYYFAQETIDFIKYCRLNDAEHTYDVLADGDISVRSLHSFDIWMPVIWVAYHDFEANTSLIARMTMLFNSSSFTVLVVQGMVLRERSRRLEQRHTMDLQPWLFQ